MPNKFTQYFKRVIRIKENSIKPWKFHNRALVNLWNLPEMFLKKLNKSESSILDGVFAHFSSICLNGVLPFGLFTCSLICMLEPFVPGQSIYVGPLSFHIPFVLLFTLALMVKRAFLASSVEVFTILF